jgi:hypothetical protein
MEKKEQDDSLRQSYAEMNKLRIEEKKNQLNTEFQRYKQDCRKRALDLAPSLITATEPDVLKKADQLYNWLISIPEK